MLSTLLRRDDNCRTALHWAAASNHGPLSEIILENAAAQRDVRAAEIAARSDAVFADADPSTLVPPAGGGFSFHAPPPLKPLLTLPDDRGNTAVHVAARGGCAEALAVLLDSAMNGLTPDAQA